MVKKVKISAAAYRVLLLMQLLNENEYGIDYLNKIFAGDPNVSRTLSKEVIIKYISTLKSAGYKISKPGSKNNHCYRLIKAPVAINLSEEELKTISELENQVSSLYQERLKKNFSSIIEKISRYLSEEQLNSLKKLEKKNKNTAKKLHSKYSKYAPLIKKFEQYCFEDQRVIVKYKFSHDNEEKQIVLEPKSIKYDSNDVYISGYNTITGEKQLLHLNNIKEIKQLPVKSRLNYVLSPVIFKLKGRVAKGYRLYEDEKITGTDPEAGTLTIAAYVDDKNMLLQRLMKYGDYCEVIYPKAVREKMISTIQETIKNYNF